jgi:hypothetical protein
MAEIVEEQLGDLIFMNGEDQVDHNAFMSGFAYGRFSELDSEMALHWFMRGAATPAECGIVSEPRNLLAAYEVMARSDGWMPIETAPKGDDPKEANGPPILIWAAGWPTGYEGYWYAPYQAWFFANLDSEYGGEEYPTHWRPLPAPPVHASSQDAAQAQEDGR